MDLESFPWGEPESWRQMHSCSIKPSPHHSCSALHILEKYLLLSNYPVSLQKYFHFMAEDMNSRHRLQVDLLSSLGPLQIKALCDCYSKWWVWVGKNFCILDQAWLAPSTEMCLTELIRGQAGILFKYYCLPLFVYITIRVYNVNIQFIFLWINFHAYIRKLFFAYTIQ